MFGFGGDYRWLVLWRKLIGQPSEDVMRQAIGGNFEAMGQMLAGTLDQIGLTAESHLVDVGCGSGRLAVQLKDRPSLRYTGIDVVPEFIDYARTICARPDWSFHLVSEPVLPLQDGSADMACFFSVFTHLPEPVCKAYLREAARVVRPGGRIVFSFLDPNVDFHAKILRGRPGLRGFVARLMYPLNIAFTPETIRRWADENGLTVERIESPSAIGQSLAVVSRP
ncbi:MAG: class I SAM-dependent methyltransferase [Hyphomonadaceae bacterium]|nr:class I SAM-dependent methyltransferase [Hyphomonadaceae bacterium]